MNKKLQNGLTITASMAIAMGVGIPVTTVLAATTSTTAPVSTYGISYEGHVQNKGWMAAVTTTGDQADISAVGEAGTDGQGLRVEAIKITGTNLPAGASITYKAHVQNKGWMAAVTTTGNTAITDTKEAGTDGLGLRVEAFKITLQGLPGYAVRYQTHVQNKGWMDAVQTDNGTAIDTAAEAGTDGQGLRMEAVRIELVKTATEKTAEIAAINAVDTAVATKITADVDAAKTAVLAVKDTVENATLTTMINGIQIPVVDTEALVKAYEVAPLVTAGDVIAAEALGSTASLNVATVSDATTKTAFEARLKTQDALVATARTAQEANAIALINNSTVYNIIARLQAPILNLQNIDTKYATEYQAARLANFTTTKAQIQSNVIDFAKTATDAVLKADLDGLNPTIIAYNNAINTTDQNNAITGMAAALNNFNGHYALTGYTIANNSAYMTAFSNAGTLTKLGEVQTTITGVNVAVTNAATAAANLTAAQTSVAGLFSSGTKTALNTITPTTQILINAALVNVNKLDDSVTQKSGLEADIQNAQGLFDAATDAATAAANLTSAQTSVTGLFAPGVKTALNVVTPTTQTIIDAALVNVNKLGNAVTEKAGLEADIQTAQGLFDTAAITAKLTAAQTSVTGLFAPGVKTALNTVTPTTQVIIDAALANVNKLDDAITEKAGLLIDVQTAQTLFDAATATTNLTTAQTSVTGLFAPGVKTALNTVTPTTQILINAALVNVNKLGNAVAEKAGLLVDVQTAQTLFDAATATTNLTAAQTSVTGLFAPGVKTALNTVTPTTQVIIDAALANVNKLADAVTEKAGLQADIVTAQNLLYAENLSTAKASVNALFLDYTTKIALNTSPAATQTVIYAALVDVNKLADGVTEKAGLKADVTTAQNLLDKASEATRLAAVNSAVNPADMNAALLDVAIAKNTNAFENLSASVKLEVAALVIDTRDVITTPTANEFADTDAVVTAISVAITNRANFLSAVNASTNITTMQAALDNANMYSDFHDLTAPIKNTDAETVLNALNALKAGTPATSFTSITEVKAVLAL